MSACKNTIVNKLSKYAGGVLLGYESFKPNYDSGLLSLLLPCLLMSMFLFSAGIFRPRSPLLWWDVGHDEAWKVLDGPGLLPPRSWKHDKENLNALNVVQREKKLFQNVVPVHIAPFPKSSINSGAGMPTKSRGQWEVRCLIEACHISQEIMTAMPCYHPQLPTGFFL